MVCQHGCFSLEVVCEWVGSDPNPFAFLRECEMKLQEIGQRFGTDKSDSHHKFAGESYLDVYESYFKDFQHKKVNLLEIGVRDGCSHEMWSDWFDHEETRVFGIDIDPRCSKTANPPSLEIVIGSQADQNTIGKVFSLLGNESFDFIIDDGSHVNELTLKSFQMLFGRLRSGGLYIIEDLGCSYLEEQLASDIVKGAWPGMHLNQGVEMVNRRKELDDFFLLLIRNLDLLKTKPYGVRSVKFHSRIVVIEKL